jgi:chaperone required for assembly of F1-ATPase
MGIERKVLVAASGIGFKVRSPTGPLKNGLWVPCRALAEAIAVEWRESGTHLERPLTRLAIRALDIKTNPDQAVASIAAYGASDLLCYWDPVGGVLSERQALAWQPLLDWASYRYGITLVVTHGIIPVEQDAQALRQIVEIVSGFGPYEMAALEDASSVCGSVIIALALFDEEIDEAKAWELSALDEIYQAGIWGKDEEAEAALNGRERALASATQFCGLLKENG